jgi:hypothetical protein
MPGTIGYAHDYDFTPDELLEVALKIQKGEKGEPIYLDEPEYIEWLKRTALGFHIEGDKLIKEAIAKIKDSSGKEELDLAIKKLSEARLIFQCQFIYTNSKLDPDPTRTGWQPRRLKK